MIVKLTFLVSNKYIFIFNKYLCKYLVGKYSTKYLLKLTIFFFSVYILKILYIKYAHKR